MTTRRSHLNRLLQAGLLTISLAGISAWAWADVTIEPETLEAKVREYVHQSTPIEDTDTTLDVEILKLPFGPITLKGDTVTFFLEDNRPSPIPYRTIVQVTMSTEGETRQIGIPIRTTLEKPVWVTKRLIRAKEAITRNDVELQRKRLDYDAGYALGSKEKIAQYQSRINLAPGTILDVRKIQAIPAVYRNDDVSMIMVVGNGVNVKVYGKALEDGAIGERIRVSRRLSNNKVQYHTAEVISKNTVQVRM